MLHGLRPLLRAGAGLWWDLHVHQRHLAPTSGPVVFACNHVGWLDGPLLAICAPRPVHALTKRDMFAGRLGAFLGGAGQIPLDRFAADPGAVKSSLRVLGDGGAVGIFPEGTRGPGTYDVFHHGATYLALVTGAPVVPVTMIGTRLPDAGTSSLPPRGSRIDVVVGDAWRTAQTPWPRTREHTLATSALLWQHLRDELSRALSLTGRALPGPLPAGDIEDDPDTGFVEHHQGAS